MADGRRHDEWERTSWLLAKLHNVHCGKASDLIAPVDVNPMHRGPRRRPGSQVIDGDFNAAMYEALKAAESRESRVESPEPEPIV